MIVIRTDYYLRRYCYALLLFLFVVILKKTAVVNCFIPIPNSCISSNNFVEMSTSSTTSCQANQNNNMNQQHQEECIHPFNELPGDPTFYLSTNVGLGEKKMEIMKAISNGVAQATGKPESYVAVSVVDKQSLLFGGSDAPTALGTLTSIGSIGKVSNGQVQSCITDLLEPYGITESRIYINFFDMPRENVGWNRATFAG